jgi:hypothetical protein
MECIRDVVKVDIGIHSNKLVESIILVYQLWPPQVVYKPLNLSQASIQLARACLKPTSLPKVWSTESLLLADSLQS